MCRRGLEFINKYTRIILCDNDLLSRATSKCVALLSTLIARASFIAKKKHHMVAQQSYLLGGFKIFILILIEIDMICCARTVDYANVFLRTHVPR